MAIQFEDLSSAAGLEKLNEYLLARSYISGYQASRDDLAAYTAITSAPDSTKYPNVARWYSHITSLLGSSFPGIPTGVKIAGSPASSATRDFTPAPAPPTPEAIPVATAAAPAAEEEEDDDDLDLFGEETEEEKAASAKREAEKKASGKKAVVGKSSVLMDVKPWDDETDMKELEKAVRSVEQDGLTWGASKLVEVGYGIKKLQIMMTIIDDLVSPDNIIEDFLTAEPRNEHIQSCDIVAFNKIFGTKVTYSTSHYLVASSKMKFTCLRGADSVTYSSFVYLHGLEFRSTGCWYLPFRKQFVLSNCSWSHNPNDQCHDDLDHLR